MWEKIVYFVAERDMFSFLSGILIAFGGFTGVVTLFSNFIITKLHKRHELNLQFKVEEFKKNLIEETHVFKARYDNENTALENMTISFLLVFESIILHTKAYEKESKLPTRCQCLEVNESIKNARNALYKAISIFPYTDLRMAEDCLAQCTSQLEKFCDGSSKGVPDSSESIMKYLSMFLGTIKEYRNLINSSHKLKMEE
jgi:hypothetical protein